MAGMISHEARHRLGCGLTGTLLCLSQSLGLYLVSSNLSNIQGSISATAAEASWLTTAYFGAALSSTLLLAKIRMHVGLQRFATVGLLCFIVAAALHVASDTMPAAV